MSVAPLTPAQVAALRRAGELAAELAHLASAVRAGLREDPSPRRPDADCAEEGGLAAGELSAAFSAAATHPRRRRGPRELFGR